MRSGNGVVVADDLKAFSAGVTESERRTALRDANPSARARKTEPGRAKPAADARELAELIELQRTAEGELRHQLDQMTDAHTAVDADRQHYRHLFESAPDAHVITDGDGLILEVNRAALSLLRSDVAVVSGKPFAAFVAPEDRMAFRDALGSAGAGDAETRFAWRGRVQPRSGDAKETDAVVVASRTTDGRALRLHWSFRFDDPRRDASSRVPPPVAAPFVAELRRNALLARFPDDVLQRVARSAAIVPVRRGEQLVAARSESADVFFPLTTALALVVRTRSGDALELGIVGAHGAVGLAGRTCAGASAQVNGTLARLPAEVIRDAGRTSTEVWALTARYAAAQAVELACHALCNRYHTLDQRLAKWMLTMQDQTGEARFAATHESMSNLLGVRRAGVTVAAGHMARAGLVHYRRGSITVADRAGLERQACECYATVRDAYASVCLADS